MSKSIFQVTERDISKMLVSLIQLDFKPADFKEKTDEILRKIKRMPKMQKAILKAAFVFSRKCPKAERQDLFQELTLKLLENKPKNESWAYTIARTDWIDWYRGYKVKAQYSTVDIESVIASDLGINAIAMKQLEQTTFSDGMPEASEVINEKRLKAYNKTSWHVAKETLTGLLEYQRIDAKIDAESLLAKIPHEIKLIAGKRMIGKALNSNERQKLCRFIKSNPELVI